MNDEMMIVE